MKRLIAVSLLAMLVASPAASETDMSRLGIGMGPAGQPGPVEAPDGNADVLVASSTNGAQFTNLSPLYAAAFLAAGATSVTQIEDAADAPFAFPAPFTSAEYPCIAILTNDNWWGNASTGAPEANVSLTDEQRIAAYMDTGGAMLFSGQDYLYARGNGNGFPQVYLGISAHVDDINFGDTDIAYGGVAGGAIDGRGGLLRANVGEAPCFTANPFFSDDITPFAVGLLDYFSSPSNVEGQGGTTWDTGGFKTVFSSVELACTNNTQQFQGDVAAISRFLKGDATGVEPATWGRVKSMFGE